ncbi:hypothetical protein EF911_11375 [Streptomyces sp. WAC06128]|nr:hypothetical protein EF911_11375 [Streptomyces sp. WAC06128]
MTRPDAPGRSTAARRPCGWRARRSARTRTDASSSAASTSPDTRNDARRTTHDARRTAHDPRAHSAQRTTHDTRARRTAEAGGGPGGEPGPARVERPPASWPRTHGRPRRPRDSRPEHGKRPRTQHPLEARTRPCRRCRARTP